MKTFALALGLAFALGAAAPAFAANARNPYGNIDRSNDRGNDTGNSQVDKLNQMQLDQARAANGPATAPMMGAPGSRPMMGAPAYQPMVPPAPAYAK